MSERISIRKGKSENFGEVYFQLRKEISNESSRNSSGSNKCEQNPVALRAKHLKKDGSEHSSDGGAQKCKCCHLKRVAPQVQFCMLRTADYLEKQTLLLVPARLCVTLQEPDSGNGKGPIFPFGLPGDCFQRGMWCLRAAEPISLVILWMGHFPVLLVTVRPQLAFISSKLL